jgi:hypothetical protein
MKELDYLKDERLRIKKEYLEASKNIWISFEEEEAEKRYKKVYNEYRSTVRNMDDLQSFRANIISGSAQWSAFVQQMYPIYETGLKQYVKK